MLKLNCGDCAGGSLGGFDDPVRAHQQHLFDVVLVQVQGDLAGLPGESGLTGKRALLFAVGVAFDG